MTLEQKVIPARVGMLELARRLDNVGRASRVVSYSRDRVYRFSVGCGVLLGNLSTSRSSHKSSVGVASPRRPYRVPSLRL